MNIAQNIHVGNNSRVVSARFTSPHKALARATSFNASSSCKLLQKPHSQKSIKPRAASKAARLVNDSHDHNNQSSSESFTSKTITVLISFLKLSKYDDEWLKLGKQLLLLKKAADKQKCYRSALCCFKSSIKTHPDNHVAYYFSGITLCLLRRYVEAVRMFLSSLRKNTETSTALMYTLSEMLSITEGIRLATGGGDVSIPHCASSNKSDSVFAKNLDKLERAIINKLQRCKIDGAVGISATNHKQRSPKDQISVLAAQEQSSKYFELGMYWHGREQGNHRALMYFKRCLQLNPANEQGNYYVGLILQKQSRYHESLEAYKKAISLRPDEGFYYYMASQVYTDLAESQEAIEMIDKAIALSPSDIVYQNMKGHIFRAFGIEQDLVDMTLEHR